MQSTKSDLRGEPPSATVSVLGSSAEIIYPEIWWRVSHLVCAGEDLGLRSRVGYWESKHCGSLKNCTVCLCGGSGASGNGKYLRYCNTFVQWMQRFISVLIKKLIGISSGSCLISE